MATKKDKMQVVRSAILDNTQEWTTSVYNVKDTMTEKAKAMSKTLTALSFSAEDKEKIASLLSAASGEKVQIESDKELEWSQLVAVVPIKTDKHGYETGKVVVLIADGIGVDENGKTGGYIPGKRDIVRPATKEEVEALTEAHVKGVIKEGNIMIV